MRLIDVEQVYCAECEYKDNCKSMIEGGELFCDVPSMPTIDAVPVVRCKDCTQWDEKEQECSVWYGFRENDYCSYGVRKDGADDGQ